MWIPAMAGGKGRGMIALRTGPALERHGFRYVNANIWNKGVGHIAGNVNTTKIRRFPEIGTSRTSRALR